MSWRPDRWAGRPLAETRWVLELSRLLADPVFRGGGVPRGDGRPVVLMPGFLAGDQTLVLLGSWLRRMGYETATCGFIANVDCSQTALERVERTAVALHERHGRRVALIGHSRGGHYARALAAGRPEIVSHAVSLGADLHGMFDVNVPTRVAVAVARGVLQHSGRARAPHCVSTACDCAFTRAFAAPFPVEEVRLTSIYSKGDGVVGWQSQIVPYADNVEVAGSHVGHVFNRKSYRAIAAALAAPELKGTT